jgi:hypothetical protein
MVQLERIEDINQRLIDWFSIDIVTGKPIWRVVYSEDQLEKRLTSFTDSGLQLLVPEVRELPKYRQWIQNKYVLERLTVIPELNSDELPSEKISYEPIYVFETAQGSALPPRSDVSKFVIDTLYAAQGKGSLAKYVEDNDVDKRIREMQDYLFGDETEVSDALSRQEGVVVPNNYKSTKKLEN